MPGVRRAPLAPPRSALVRPVLRKLAHDPVRSVRECALKASDCLPVLEEEDEKGEGEGRRGDGAEADRAAEDERKGEGGEGGEAGGEGERAVQGGGEGGLGDGTGRPAYVPCQSGNA